MRGGGLGGAFQFGEDLCGEDLAEFHAPLVEAVDVPDGSLGEDGVLVEGDELAEDCGGEGGVGLECLRDLAGGLDGGVLALEDARGAGEGEMGDGDASGLDDASFFGDVAVEDGQAAIGAEGVREVADDSGVAVEVEIGIVSTSSRLVQWSICFCKPNPLGLKVTFVERGESRARF